MRKRSRQIRLCPVGTCESLEHRCLLHSSLSNGVLTVTGTSVADTFFINTFVQNNTIQILHQNDGSVENWPIAQVSSIVVNLLGGADVLNYDLSDGAPATVNGSTGGDTINIQATEVGKTVTINAGDDNDAMVLGGSSGGLDTLLSAVVVNGEAGSDSLTLTDGPNTGNETYPMTATTIDRAVFGGATYGTIETLNVDAGSGRDIFNVTANAATTSVHVTGGNSPDLLDLGAGTGLLDPVHGTFSFTGDAASDSVSFNDSNNDDMILGPTYTINGTTVSRSGGPIVSLQAENLTVQTGVNPDFINVLATASGVSTVIFGGNGADDFTVGNNDLDAGVIGALNMHGDAGSDELHFIDASDTGSDGYNFTSVAFAKPTLTPTILYDDFSILSLDANPFSNAINVLSLGAAGVPVNLTVNAGAGFDGITIASGDLDDDINGNVTVDGGADNDTLTINDTTDTGIDFWTIVNSTIDKSNFELISYAAIETITIDGSGEGSLTTVAGLPTGGSNLLTLNGNGGNDAFEVGDATTGLGNLALGGTINVFGGAGTDSLLVDDNPGAASAFSYSVTEAIVDRSFFGQINYALLETLTLDASIGDSAITVSNTSAGTPVTVRGNDGVDTIDILQTNATAPVTIDSGPLDDTVNVNTDNSGTASAIFAQTQQLAALNIGAGGNLSVTAGGNKIVNTKALSISATGKLDLFDNDLELDYTGNSPLPTVQGWINLARNGGTWNGPGGITSSSAAAQALHNTTLGAIEGSQFQTVYGIGATFDGQTVDNTAVLVKYTYYGDADFSGKVDGADYARLDATFNNEASQGNIGGWFNGDCDGNGKIDGADYALIDAAFNSQGAPLRPAGGSPARRQETR